MKSTWDHGDVHPEYGKVVSIFRDEVGKTIGFEKDGQMKLVPLEEIRKLTHKGE